MRPTFDVTERRVRIEVEGEPRWGRRNGERIVLEDGTELDEGGASYLAPAEPTKIVALAYNYKSLFADPAAAEHRRARALEQVRQEFSWERIAGLTADIFAQVVEARRKTVW